MIQSTRTSRKEATRRALKESALRCLVDRPLAEVPIGAIASGAGVAHGTFYVHFESKEALLDELLADFNQGLVLHLMPLWSQDPLPVLEVLVRQTAGLFLDYWQARRGFVEAYVNRLAGGVSLTELRDGINPPMVALLGARLPDLLGALSPGDVRAELATQALLAMWMRIGLQALFNDRVPREVAVDTLVSLTLGVLAGLGGSR